MSCISMKGTIYKFKKHNSLEVRKKESRRILGKFSDRIPIIVEKSHGDLPELDKKKFLAPLDLTMGSFIYIIRKRIKLNAEHAMFLFINGLLVSNSETVGHIYHQHKDVLHPLKELLYFLAKSSLSDIIHPSTRDLLFQKQLLLRLE